MKYIIKGKNQKELMKNKYYAKYFKSIGQGLMDSIYYLDQQKIEPELFFETINNFLLGLYTIMKNSIVDLPWPIVIALVVLITYFASGRKTNTTVMVAFCTFFLGFLSPRYWDKCIMTTCIVVIGMILCIAIGIPVGIAMARNKKVRNALLPILDLMQTIPSFCYLIPGILLFGLGAVPAIIAIFV